MPIRREGLQILKPKRTDDHCAANDKQVPGVSEREDRTKQCKGDYMLDVSKSSHAWVQKEG
jgi:hypothetical protein